MALTPPAIRKKILHRVVSIQIAGFEDLFVHLERSSSAAGELRQLVVDYFSQSSSLRSYLSTSSPSSADPIQVTLVQQCRAT